MNRILLCCVVLSLATAWPSAQAAISAADGNAPLSGARDEAKNRDGYLPRVGDSLEELSGRLGPGKKNAGKIRTPGNDEYYWEMRNVGVNVVVQSGKAVMLVAHGVNHKITAAEINELLNANSHGQGWHPDARQPRWVRNDTQLEAFRERNHEDMFFLQDIAIVAKSGYGATPGAR